jgi:hypothetical protein
MEDNIITVDFKAHADTESARLTFLERKFSLYRQVTEILLQIKEDDTVLELLEIIADDARETLKELK